MTDIKLLGHRGSNPFPDHSMDAYKAAINWGADFIENDLYLTKDGVLVCSHDNHDFSNKTYAQALAENPNLVTLDQAVALVKQQSIETGRQINLTIETKSTDYATSEAVIKKLVELDFTDPSRVYINSFASGNLQSLNNDIMPRYGVDLPLLLLTSGMSNLEQIATYCDGIAPSVGSFTKEQVDQAHALGLEVHAWTINGAQTDVQNLINLGVDAVYVDSMNVARPAAEQIDGIKVVYGSETGNELNANAGNDLIYAMQGNDVVRAKDGDDTAYGDAGNDLLFGGAGNDHLVGGGGTDFLQGDAGSDLLDGSAGNDVIVASGDKVLFRAGAGIDLVSLDNASTISFDDIASGDVTIVQDGDNLIIRSGDDALVIRNGGNASGLPASITFSDGVTWTGAELAGHATTGTDAAVEAALPALEDVLATAPDLATEPPPPPVAVGTDLIVNGNFEDVTGLASKSWGYYNDGGVMPGWTDRAGHRVEIHEDIQNGVGPKEGTRYFDMDGDGHNVTLVQHIARAEEGATYRLTFSIADADGTTNDDGVRVLWNGQVIYEGVPNNSWNTFSFDLVGGSGDGSNELIFQGTETDQNWYGVALDDVHFVKIAEAGEPVPENVAPDAVAGEASGDQGTVLTGRLAATDANGDVLAYSLGDGPAHGSVVINADGTYKYTPANGFAGTDIFTFLANDGHGGVDEASMTLTINPAAVNLIVNGNFEDLTGANDVASWGYRNTNPAGIIAGWANVADTRAEVHKDIVGGIGAAEGTYWFDMEGANKNAKLVQSVAGVEAGATYQLKFSIADTDTVQASDTIKVYWGGQLIYTGIPKGRWQEITIDVTGGAGDGSNKLAFESTTASSNGAGVALDDISMIKVDANPNLIVNGSFEDLTGATGNNGASDWGYRNESGVIAGWKQTNTAAGGRAEVHFDTLNGVGALDGKAWFDMDGNKNNARLVQAVAGVEAGKTYELKFSIADIDAAANDDGIRVTWGGQVIFEGIASAGWETHAFRVVGGAGDGKNELIFEGTQTNKNGYGAALDDVSLRRIDVPAGTEGDDILTGTAGADVISGLAGDDLLSGLAGNDVIDGGEGDDTLDGGDGNDTLLAGAGIDDDDLFGGAGDDRLTGNGGDNVLDGGDGIDTADYTADAAGVDVNLAAGEAFGDASGSDALSGIEIVLGGSGNDTLTGDAAANTLNGGAGNDVLGGGAGDDTIIGGEGIDTLVLNGATGAILLDLVAGKASATGLGTDSFSGIEAFRLGDGDDVATLVAGTAPVGPIDGGNGHDTLVLTGAGVLGALTGVEQLDLQGNWTVTGTGADVVFQDGAQTLSIDSAFTGTIGALGQDDRIQLLGFAGSEATLGAGNLLTITGATGTHTLQLDPADDYAGMAFTVEADGQGGSYLAYGPANAGDDVLTGGNGSDVLDGGAGNDTITGGAGNDTLSGGQGLDTVDGGSGDDLVTGGAGDDQIKGGSGIDHVDGGDGNDVIDAGSDADIVLGGAGNDQIKAGSGDDVITGGAGNDVLSGGSGHDGFVFAAGFGHDTVSDFALTGSSSDTIQFDAGIFADFAAVEAHAEQVGHDVVITLDQDHSLTLSNVALASLSADDFRFAA